MTATSATLRYQNVNVNAGITLFDLKKVLQLMVKPTFNVNNYTLSMKLFEDDFLTIDHYRICNIFFERCTYTTNMNYVILTTNELLNSINEILEISIVNYTINENYSYRPITKYDIQKLASAPTIQASYEQKRLEEARRYN